MLRVLDIVPGPCHGVIVPTVLRIRGYRFHFFSNERNEPPHIHVDAAENTVKVWLDTLVITQAAGYDGRELREVVDLVRAHREELTKAWNEYFKTDG